MNHPQFDTYLLHLPPINLHSIALLYRSRTEYQDSRATAQVSPICAQKPRDIAPILARILANRA